MKFAAVLVAACAALLAAGCASTEAETVTAEADAGPVTCQDIRSPNTNVIESVCMTQSEWEEFRRERRRQSQEATRRMQGFSGGF